MNKNLNDFAVDGIGGRFADNPVPDILAGLEAGSALDGFSPLIKLIPTGDTILVPLSIGGGVDWYAAFAGDGPVFLRVDHGEMDRITAADNPSSAALANLLWIMSDKTKPEPDDDFEVEVAVGP